MANKKITELTALTTAASDDVLAIVDVSGTAETKKITVANLTGGGGGTTTVKVSLSNADVLAMKYNNTPITLKAAEASKIIMPITVVCVATHAGANETSSDDLRMGWDASQSTTSKRWGEIRDWMNGVTTGTNSTCFGGISSPGVNQTLTFSITNSPFQIWCTDVFNGGWTMDVYFSYVMLDA
tara:strand:+ start:230 stop:778 length:549 start_codon:yes stop_codon:yes gene_type:complete